jgi:DNA processing protein
MKWQEYKIEKAIKGNKNYPKNLLSLAQPPGQLYYRGELGSEPAHKSIAVVGSRRMTRYGASVIDKFVAHFVANGVSTVSGYMYGVDTELHTRTVEYGGKTIAVMGGGINQPYPPENDKLYTKILHYGGAVLSEYDPEGKPKLWMYPQRNRIIAALATIGVLVIEASEKSGSLITVRFARKLKKKIYAVPGPITSSVSSGTNFLIKKGWASMVVSPEDITGAVKAENGNGALNDLVGIEKQIYEVLESEEMSIDEIAVATGKNLVEISTTVSLMALKGLLSEAGGKYFVV